MEAWLARDGLNAVKQNDRVACIGMQAGAESSYANAISAGETMLVLAPRERPELR